MWEPSFKSQPVKLGFVWSKEYVHNIKAEKDSADDKYV